MTAEVAQIDIVSEILNTCDRHTLSGQRDYAILRLLSENALKRQQVTAINIDDFDNLGRSLRITSGYNRQSQQRLTSAIKLSPDTAEALQAWLDLIYIPDQPDQVNLTNQLSNHSFNQPLFISLDRANYGHRLTGTAIYGIVRRAALKAGLKEAIAPEQLRLSQEKYSSNQDNETPNKTTITTDETQLILTEISHKVSNLEGENQK